MKDKILDTLCNISEYVQKKPKRVAFVIFVAVVMILALLTGCSSVAQPNIEQPSKQDLIIKYEGKTAINDWSEEDKAVMLNR